MWQTVQLFKLYFFADFIPLVICEKSERRQAWISIQNNVFESFCQTFALFKYLYSKPQRFMTSHFASFPLLGKWSKMWRHKPLSKPPPLYRYTYNSRFIVWELEAMQWVCININRWHRYESFIISNSLITGLFIKPSQVVQRAHMCLSLANNRHTC